MKLAVNKSAPPTFNLLVKYALIALCVGTILFESAVNKGSVLNSLITVPVPPTLIPPSANSDRPLRSKKSALIVTIPVACSTANNSPHLKLPDWSVLAQNTLPPLNSCTSFSGYDRYGRVYNDG